MNFSFLDPWHLFLPREGGHIIGLMGSGGKTSLQRSLAGVYAAEGLPTILTTTTRTEPWPDVPVVEVADLEQGASHLPDSFYLRDGEDGRGKWRGLQPEVVDRLEEIFPDRVILVEVDGAAKKNLKLYKPGEPVWPGRTSLAIVVLGAGAVGGFVREHVHRLGRISSPVLDPLPAGALVEWDHVHGLLKGKGGYLEQIPGDTPALLALSQMAQVQDSIGLFDFVGRAMEDARLPITLFFETQGEAPSFRAGCRQDRGPGEDE